MKSRFLLPFLLPVLACSGDKAAGEYEFAGGEFTIHFAATVGDEAFACGKTFDSVGSQNTAVEAQDFRFYVSNLRLVTAEGDEVEVDLVEDAPFQSSRVALLDFEDATGACSANGSPETNMKLRVSAPEGRYQGLRFSTSVPEDLNHRDPTSNPDPLQVTSMQWNWLLGYKFMRAEMRPLHQGGMGGAGGADGQTGHGHMGADSQFHLGSLGCTNEDGATSAPDEECKKPNRNEIYLKEFHPEKEAIVADLGAMMQGADLTQMNHCHGATSDACVSNYASVGIDYETGELLETQSAFRKTERD